MKVKNRLSLQFTFMFAVLLLLVLTGVYLFEENNRLKNFFNKLDDRAITVAQFYLAEDNLSKENFNRVLKKFPQTLSGESIRIYDDQYRPKFIPEDSIRWNQDILKKITAKEKVHFSKNRTQIAGIYYADNSGNFIIVVSATDDSGYDNMHELSLIMISFFMASLIITFFMGRIFASISLLPIVKITRELKNIRSSSLDLRLPVNPKNADEIDGLSLTINHLLEHLEQSFESQKSFIANASHELRTPITTILGEAEITLMQPRSAEDYKATLANIIKETDRLSYIINSLMDLIQTNVSNYGFQSIRMDELLWEVVGDLSDKNIKVRYNLPTNRLKYTLQGNRNLLFIGLNNIIKNAIKFSDGKEIYCEIFCSAQSVNILVTDQGIGIQETDLNKIFQPFFRSPNALNYAGYGIGLSLTQNIVRLHNGVIEVKSELNKGTRFLLIFPTV